MRVRGGRGCWVRPGLLPEGGFVLVKTPRSGVRPGERGYWVRSGGVAEERTRPAGCGPEGQSHAPDRPGSRTGSAGVAHLTGRGHAPVGRRSPLAEAAGGPGGEAVGQSAALKPRSRRLLPTTKTEEKAMAAPAIIGLSSPAAASGSAATL